MGNEDGRGRGRRNPRIGREGDGEGIDGARRAMRMKGGGYCIWTPPPPPPPPTHTHTHFILLTLGDITTLGGRGREREGREG